MEWVTYASHFGNSGQPERGGCDQLTFEFLKARFRPIQVGGKEAGINEK
jgi:hypothetical protein